MNESPREVLDSLLTNGKLDGLLTEARKHAAAIAVPTVASSRAQLDAALDDVTKHAAAVRDGLVQAVSQREKLREQKVAYVRQLLHTSSRLLGA